MKTSTMKKEKKNTMHKNSNELNRDKPILHEKKIIHENKASTATENQIKKNSKDSKW